MARCGKQVMAITQLVRPSLARGVRCRLACIVCFLFSLMSVGCGDEADIVTYPAPKEPPPAPIRAALPQPPPTAVSAALTWTPPDGWTQQKSDGMRVATIKNTDADQPIEIAVTQFPGDVGGVTANVNRWRRELQLDPVDDAQAESLAPALAGGRLPGRLIDLIGAEAPTAAEPPSRMLVAWFQHSGQSWFFKLRAAEPAVAANLESFLQLARSVHPTQSDQPNIAAAPNSAEAKRFNAGLLRGAVPVGWRMVVPPKPPRLLSMTVDRNGQTAELAVTRFPGDVGGELANVNRWRNQLGLTPVADAAQQESRKLDLNGAPTTIYHFTAEGEAPGRSRMIVAVIQRGDMSWFIKLTGPADLLQTQAGAFVDFLTQLRFNDES